MNVRILAATHVDLPRAIAERRFREDLYYRLSVFPLQLLPLRERLEDLPRLCVVLLDEQARRTGRRGMKVTKDGLSKLARHPWPGNLRELGNVLERATILAPGRELGPEVLDLPARSGPLPHERGPARSGGKERVLTLDDAQKAHVEHVLRLTAGRIYGPEGAAELLGVKPSTLQSRMKKLGVRRATSPRRA
jgi:DNA-binding NtrC family response regulator